MSIRGAIFIECDRKTCHAEIVLSNEDATVADSSSHGLLLELSAHGWHADEDDNIWCPDCLAAARRERETHADDGRDYADPGDFLRGYEN